MATSGVAGLLATAVLAGTATRAHAEASGSATFGVIPGYVAVEGTVDVPESPILLHVRRARPIVNDDLVSEIWAESAFALPPNFKIGFLVGGRMQWGYARFVDCSDGCIEAGPVAGLLLSVSEGPFWMRLTPIGPVPYAGNLSVGPGYIPSIPWVEAGYRILPSLELSCLLPLAIKAAWVFR